MREHQDHEPNTDPNGDHPVAPRRQLGRVHWTPRLVGTLPGPLTRQKPTLFGKMGLARLSLTPQILLRQSVFGPSPTARTSSGMFSGFPPGPGHVDTFAASA